LPPSRLALHIYQQRRRIKLAAGGKATANKRQTVGKTTTKPKAKAPRKPRAPRRDETPALTLVSSTEAPADPLREVKLRKAEIDAELSIAKTDLDAAAKMHDAAQKAFDDAESQMRPELERLAAVEALLTGKLAPPKAQPRRKPAQAPAPEPQAEHVAEAAAQDAAAEAPDEPTEVPASDNGAGEERPGVPTVPEFSQEDAFAS
jgi:hypothetical protein